MFFSLKTTTTTTTALLVSVLVCVVFPSKMNSQEHGFGSIVDHVNSDGTKTMQFIMNNGDCLPLVGFGTWQLGNNASLIRDAIKSGYRSIDTAYIYGNEQAIGQALSEMIKNGDIKRQDMFITTKVWNNHHSKARVKKSIRDSMQKLKVDQLDLVLLHYPTGFAENVKDDYPKYPNGSIIPRTSKRDAYLESWEAMEDAVRSGLTRSIGVSNFNKAQMEKLLAKAKIKPVLNQVESNPYFKQSKLLEYLLKNQVLMQAYAPIRRADKDLLNDSVLKSIGEKYKKSTAQVALRWQLDRFVPIVVKSSNPKRMLSNNDIFDFQLTKNEMKQIDSMPEKERIYDISGIESHPDYPFNEKL